MNEVEWANLTSSKMQNSRMTIIRESPNLPENIIKRHF